MTPPEIQWEHFDAFVTSVFNIFLIYAPIYFIFRFIRVFYVKKSAERTFVETKKLLKEECGIDLDQKQSKKEHEKTHLDQEHKPTKSKPYMTVSNKNHSKNMEKYDRRLEVLKGYRVVKKTKEE